MVAAGVFRRMPFLVAMIYVAGAVLLFLGPTATGAFTCTSTSTTISILSRTAVPSRRANHHLSLTQLKMFSKRRCFDNNSRSSSLLRRFQTIDAASDRQEENLSNQLADLPLLKDAARTLKRASWFSWWSQVILTVITSVILLFARSSMNLSGAKRPTSFFLSGCGVFVSAVSIVWTWGNGARLSRRLVKPPTISRYAAAQMLRRAIKVGVTVNLIGLLCHLLAAQQIIGTLAIKVLTTQTTRSANFGGLLISDGLQPLDVLIVQASTNSLLSQFCSLASLLYLTTNVNQLDPPSTNETRRGK